MNRTFPLMAASLLVAAAATPVFAQQVQRPATTPQPATQPTPASTPSTIPSDPTRRLRPAGAIPEAGPSTPARPAPPTQPMQTAPPATPMPVRDAQGRIIPGAEPTAGDRARDPVTGQEFQTAPVPKRPG